MWAQMRRPSHRTAPLMPTLGFCVHHLGAGQHAQIGATSMATPHSTSIPQIDLEQLLRTAQELPRKPKARSCVLANQRTHLRLATFPCNQQTLRRQLQVFALLRFVPTQQFRRLRATQFPLGLHSPDQNRPATIHSQQKRSMLLVILMRSALAEIRQPTRHLHQSIRDYQKR